MSKPSTSHLERTATEPRQSGLHRASICYIRNINPRVRLLRLALPYAVQFLPGQWLDVHIPALPDHTGGFTITSTPADASEDPPQDLTSSSTQNRRLSATPRPYFELAIQQSPTNPPAAWLWKDGAEIMNKDVLVRVGGNFTWSDERREVNKVVFIAGGVGINPLMSMLSHLAQPRQKQSRPTVVKLLYSTRLGGGTLEQILFFSRLKRIFQELNSGTSSSSTIDLHISGGLPSLSKENVPSWMSFHNDRISHSQLLSALGITANSKHDVEVYVCGPPAMTDEFVEVLRSQENMKDNVFCENWW